MTALPHLRGFVPTLLLIQLCVLGAARAAAQSDSHITISGGIHALTVPWYPGPMTNRFNPAAMVGIDRNLRSSDHWRFFYAVNLGFFRHHWWMTGVSIEPDIGIGRMLAGGFRADLRVGLGYLHFFWRRKTLELEGGRYGESRDWGRPSVILPLSLSLGYPGKADHPSSVSPFITARWGVQALFLEEVPALTHLQFLAGVRVDTKSEASERGR